MTGSPLGPDPAGQPRRGAAKPGDDRAIAAAIAEGKRLAPEAGTLVPPPAAPRPVALSDEQLARQAFVAVTPISFSGPGTRIPAGTLTPQRARGLLNRGRIALAEE